MLFSVLGTVFSLGGNLLIMAKKRLGWLVWILGNLCWIGYNWFGEWNTPMVLMYVVYFVINVGGFIEWSKKKKD